MAYVDWIKLEHTTPNKQEIGRISELLGIDPDEAFGKVVRFWIWADQNTEDGNLNVTTCGYIDRIVMKPGFAEAMISVGWLVKVNEFLRVPNFGYHMDKSAKSRANNVKKVRKSRAKEDERKPECNQNVTDDGYKKVSPSSSSSTSSSLSIRDKGGVGEKGETPPPAPRQPEPAPAPITSAADIFQDLPKQLDTQQFRDEWRQWERYMRDTHGRPIGLMQRQPGWQMMIERAPAGQEAAFAVNTIRQAMAAGWKNLYPKQEIATNGTRKQTSKNTGESAGGGIRSGIKPAIRSFMAGTAGSCADTAKAGGIHS